MVDGRRRWRWSNVPVPEPHVGGLVVGTAIQLLWPWPAVDDQRLALTVGAVVIALALVVIGWAVRTMGDRAGRRRTNLVTTGPYAHSRHPMYVGWTALYLGIALALNAVWLYLLLPVVAAITHLIVRREERSLEREFGEAYRAYRREVRRYL